MNEAFLEEALGKEGADALGNSLLKAPILKSVIFPRTIVSWLGVMNTMGYDGELPGKESSYISFVKSEDGTFSGAITIEDSLYEFDKADLLHVAATVGVALGINCDEIDDRLKTKDLTQLGKSIDLLVKMQFLKRIKDSNIDIIPEEALEPELPQNEPVKKISPRAIKLTKAESKSFCEDCGMFQFVDDRFKGCLCLGELAKSVKTKNIGNDYLLIFKANELDFADVSTIVAAFKE